MANTIQKEISFAYRTKKDEKTGMVTKRPNEVIRINFPLVADLVAEASEKGLSLIQDAIEAVIVARARELLDDITGDKLDFSLLEWEAIASLPAAQRKSSGIPKELWDEFATDYIAVMPAITGKTVEQVTGAASLLVKRLNSVKTSKDHMTFFEEQLGLYMEHSPSAVEYMPILEVLLEKIKEYSALTADDLLKNL